MHMMLSVPCDQGGDCRCATSLGCRPMIERVAAFRQFVTDTDSMLAERHVESAVAAWGLAGKYDDHETARYLRWSPILMTVNPRTRYDACVHSKRLRLYCFASTLVIDRVADQRIDVRHVDHESLVTGRIALYCISHLDRRLYPVFTALRLGVYPPCLGAIVCGLDGLVVVVVVVADRSSISATP